LDISAVVLIEIGKTVVHENGCWKVIWKAEVERADSGSGAIVVSFPGRRCGQFVFECRRVIGDIILAFIWRLGVTFGVIDGNFLDLKGTAPIQMSDHSIKGGLKSRSVPES
jgi:hypothetical protein